MSDLAPRARLLWTIGLMLLALLVRLPSLTDRSWWIDELITRDIGRLPLWKAEELSPANRFVHSKIGFCLYDTGPGPLTYVLEGLLSKQAEPIQSEYWLRIPGIIAGTIIIPILLYGIFPSLKLPILSSLVGASLAAVFPAWVDWSTGARGYAWVLLVGWVQLWAGILWLAEKRAPLLLFLALLTLVGLLMHPFHIIFSSALWVSLIAASWKPRPLLLLSFLTVLAAQAGLLFYWLSHVSQVSPVGIDSELGLEAFAKALPTLVSQEWPLLLFLVMLAVTGVVGCRNPSLPIRLVGWLALFMGVLGLALAVLLTIKLFPAFRYFYGATIPALVLLAHVAERVELRFPRLSPRIIHAFALLPFVWLAVLSVRTANTPIHNWSHAVQWLRQHAAPEDVVLTGPNSEYEVYRIYANAAKVQAQAPLTISNPAGTKISVQSPAAIQALLNTKRRLWFITAFYGQHRSSDYWNLIGQNFRETARFEGRADLVVLSNQ